MLPGIFGSTSYERKRYPMATDHGTLRPNYAGAPVSVVGRGSAQPGTGAVDVINRNGSEIVYSLFVPPSADILDQDLIVLYGRTYRVNGEPERWDVGFLNHQVVRLSAWVG